jgi:hypothetical protein
MAHSLARGDEYPDVTCGDSNRARYRFGRIHVRHVRARTALSRVSGHLKKMIAAVADAKLRRMERELELRGVGFSRAEKSLAAHPSPPTGRPQGSSSEK